MLLFTLPDILTRRHHSGGAPRLTFGERGGRRVALVPEAVGAPHGAELVAQEAGEGGPNQGALQRRLQQGADKQVHLAAGRRPWSDSGHRPHHLSQQDTRLQMHIPRPGTHECVFYALCCGPL